MDVPEQGQPTQHAGNAAPIGSRLEILPKWKVGRCPQRFGLYFARQLLLRISIGLEEPNELWADLSRLLSVLGQASASKAA